MRRNLIRQRERFAVFGVQKGKRDRVIRVGRFAGDSQLFAAFLHVALADLAVAQLIVRLAAVALGEEAGDRVERHGEVARLRHAHVRRRVALQRRREREIGDEAAEELARRDFEPVENDVKRDLAVLNC